MNTKARIFPAARKRFERGGIEGLSMRHIAKDCRLTVMAFYRHFPDKQAIIDALTLDALADASRGAEAEFQRHLSGIEPALFSGITKEGITT